MNVLPSSAINALAVANKLASIRNRINPAIADEFEADPRLIEVLWLIQWASTEAGGLSEFSRRLIERFPQRFVTEVMVDVETQRDGKYRVEDIVRVWWSLASGFTRSAPTCKFCDILDNRESLNFSALRRDGMAAELQADLTPEFFGERCRWEALTNLPSFLHSLCTNPNFSPTKETLQDLKTVGHFHRERYISATWWCADIKAALYAMMDDHAARVETRLSRTSVVIEVWDALDYAWHTRGFVTIEGNTRFGKTEASRSWADKYPGRVRYLAVPHSASEKELLAEVAAAFRLPYTWSTPEAQLREEISFILQFGRIGLIADEGQFLIPTRFHKGTSPHRLNWFRTQLVDRRVPCALCYTGQFTKDLARYAKSTGYVVDQWLGRPKLRVKLPDALPDNDTLAVVQKHLPWCSEGLRIRIAGRAKASHSFLKAIEDVADRARWIATKARRGNPTEEDALMAMEETLPDMDSLLTVAPKAREHAPSLVSGERIAPDSRRASDQAKRPSPAKGAPLTFPETRRDGSIAELITTG